MGANFSDLGLVNWHRLIPDPAIRARTLVVLDVEFPDSYGFNAVCAPVQIDRVRRAYNAKENEPTSAPWLERPPNAPHPLRRLRRESGHA